MIKACPPTHTQNMKRSLRSHDRVTEPSGLEGLWFQREGKWKYMGLILYFNFPCKTFADSKVATVKWRAKQKAMIQKPKWESIHSGWEMADGVQSPPRKRKSGGQPSISLWFSPALFPESMHGQETYHPSQRLKNSLLAVGLLVGVSWSAPEFVACFKQSLNQSGIKKTHPDKSFTISL